MYLWVIGLLHIVWSRIILLRVRSVGCGGTYFVVVVKIRCFVLFFYVSVLWKFFILVFLIFWSIIKKLSAAQLLLITILIINLILTTYIYFQYVFIFYNHHYLIPNNTFTNIHTLSLTNSFTLLQLLNQVPL